MRTLIMAIILASTVSITYAKHYREIPENAWVTFNHGIPEDVCKLRTAEDLARTDIVYLSCVRWIEPRDCEGEHETGILTCKD